MLLTVLQNFDDTPIKYADLTFQMASDPDSVQALNDYYSLRVQQPAFSFVVYDSDLDTV
jgi:hypothetical protein